MTSVSAFVAVVTWLGLCLALGLAGGLIALAVLPQLGRYAPAFGLPVALFALGIVGLWLGHVSITLGLWVSVGLLVAGAAVTVRRVDWRDRFRAGLPATGVFLVTVLFMLGLRAVDPAVDPASGEKFLNFGLLQAHLRASALPAEDIWFAGEPFSYYYGGHFVASLLARLTGTPARYAYNLSLATFYATLVTAAYGLAGAIGARWDAGRAAALAGAFFIGVASNLLPALRLALWALPEPLASVASPVADSVTTRGALAPAAFDYWPASRVVPDMISEFPLFAYLNGDLHAHMLAMPFQLLAVACLYAYFRTDADRRRYRQALLVGVVPAITGFVTATNAWALPILGGLTWLTLSVAPATPVTLGFDRLWASVTPGRNWLPVWPPGRRVVVSTLAVGVVTVLSIGWSLPFWLVSATSGMTPGLFPARSPLASLLVVHGAFLAVLVPYLLRRLPSRTGVRASVAGGGVTVVLTAALAPTVAGVVLFGGLGLVAGVVLRRARSADQTGYESLLAFAALSLVVLVELAYLEEPAVPGRFNTFFKTYAQVWVLFGVAAGVVVGRFVASHRSLAVPHLSGRATRTVLVAALLLSTGVYGVGSTYQWTTEADGVRRPDDPTLDALAFADQRHPHQMDAIEWLDDRSGTPTIMSAPGASIWQEYRWVNAPSSLTGIPTVAGWAHEAGYRGFDAYWHRVGDVGRTFNGSRTDRYRYLRQYEVDYVVYGPPERHRYGPHLFDNETVVTPAYENPAVTIYRVDQTALANRTKS